MTCRFYLGSPESCWLARTAAPLFVSARRLRRVKRGPPPSVVPWALDSGGFTELSKFGRWETTPEVYAAEAVRWMRQAGGLAFAAPQDWMCEPFMVDKTGLTVADHQRLTVDNLALLRRLAPSVPWVPVLQGWTRDDYLRCRDAYLAAGIDLAAEPLVGLGSVCRRQDTDMAERLIRELAADGLRLHGFGFKTEGLRRVGNVLASADSMAWSKGARCRRARLPDCRHKGDCRNCMRYALAWRGEVLAAIPRPQIARAA